jgi:hypothetical protein
MAISARLPSWIYTPIATAASAHVLSASPSSRRRLAFSTNAASSGESSSADQRLSHRSPSVAYPRPYDPSHRSRSDRTLDGRRAQPESAPSLDRGTPMGWTWRFWRRTRIAPGVTANWSRSGPSISVGPRGAKMTIGRRGIRRTVGIPGTGLSASNQQSWASLRNREPVSPVAGPDHAQPAHPAPAVPVPTDPCGFCGGEVGPDGRCTMCGPPASRWGRK